MKSSEDWDDLEDLDFSSSITKMDLKNKKRQSDETLCRQVGFFYIHALFGLISLGFPSFFIMLLFTLSMGLETYIQAGKGLAACLSPALPWLLVEC